MSFYHNSTVSPKHRLGTFVPLQLTPAKDFLIDKIPVPSRCASPSTPKRPRLTTGMCSPSKETKRSKYICSESLDSGLLRISGKRVATRHSTPIRLHRSLNIEIPWAPRKNKPAQTNLDASTITPTNLALHPFMREIPDTKNLSPTSTEMNIELLSSLIALVCFISSFIIAQDRIPHSELCRFICNDSTRFPSMTASEQGIDKLRALFPHYFEIIQASTSGEAQKIINTSHEKTGLMLIELRDMRKKLVKAGYK